VAVARREPVQNQLLDVQFDVRATHSHVANSASLIGLSIFMSSERAAAAR
jgi:hypothetical protein